jgi:membrane protein YqaA with SNARE-associated domain
MAKAASPQAPRWLGVIAFIESSIFPIPPDALLIPMCLARRAKAFFYAGVCTISSVAGGMLGYALGALFFSAIGAPIVALYGGDAAMAELRLLYAEQGALIVAFAAFTPFPFKVVTIASGALSMDIGVFLVASLLARGGRFMLVAALIWRFGAPIQAFIEKHMGWVTLAGFVVLAAFFIFVKKIAG